MIESLDLHLCQKDGPEYQGKSMKQVKEKSSDPILAPISVNVLTSVSPGIFVL